ncbi:MAG: hypothetical protein A2V86_17420 [Deltaproteobacteria bacterium RBG_16_49_23]|nr:MAG: hypothetical protein A2V86_17420 [Deltaproteobacteria bacterium RBG_16_49_23]
MKTICLVLSTVIILWSSISKAKDFKFPEIAGWKQSGEIETFIPKNLYEYINGAADLYLMYDFEELKVAEYQNEKKASVTVDVYRHRTPLHAFGIYSQERLPEANFLDIGIQGYYEKGFLNFLTGPYYLKLSAINTGPEDQEVLVAFAKRTAENLGPKGSFPSILSAFPAEGKQKHSEKFIARNFLGYAFLHSSFTADYELQAKKFKLFVIERENRDECKNMIEKYLQTIKSPRKDVTEGRYTLSDPHHGEIDLHWQGKYIWGILNLNEVSLRLKYLKLFEEGLKKKVLSD